MLHDGPAGAPIDRYVVQEYLAEGGMGAIYLGKKLGAGGFEKEVVLKQLLPEFTQQPEFIDLFLREARLSATLDHANIIHTIDLVTAGEEYFIVMEYLDGADLRTLLKRARLRRRRFSAPAALFIAREMLSALTYAHGKLGPDGKPLRLIHRDISPSNILISGQGEVKLTDFGIAKAATHNSVFYRVKGKIGYMSPEQARSETLDNRSDLYSLAVCLYEMITGERLFVQTSLLTSAEAMYSQPVPLISRKIEGLPPELDKVMLKALSVDRNHRYQTAGEFQDALLRCAHRHNLMMSAPELATTLRFACGDPRQWRDLDSVEDMLDDGGSTELYDEADVEPSGTLRLPEEEADGVAMVGLGQLIDEEQRRFKRAKTSVTELGRLQNLELTSFINIGDEGPPQEVGAEPLVDLNTFKTGIGGDDHEAAFADDSGEFQPVGRIDTLLPTPNPDQQPSAQVPFADPTPEPARAKRSTKKPKRAKRQSQKVVQEQVVQGVDPSASESFDVSSYMAPSKRPWLIVLLLLLALAGGIVAALGLSVPEVGDNTSPSPQERPTPE
jgi:hypothetical protein